MIKSVVNKIRIVGHDVLSTRRGDKYKAIRVGLEVLNVVNELVGKPFRSSEELASASQKPTVKVVSSRQTEAAPVMVYFEGKDHRTLEKIESILKSATVPYQVLDVSRDDAAQSWLKSVTKHEDLPVVFIAGECIGGLTELAELDLNGTLKKKVFN
jgi:glutaredoxin-related protein